MTGRERNDTLPDRIAQLLEDAKYDRNPVTICLREQLLKQMIMRHGAHFWLVRVLQARIEQK